MSVVGQKERGKKLTLLPCQLCCLKWFLTTEVKPPVATSCAADDFLSTQAKSAIDVKQAVVTPISTSGHFVSIECATAAEPAGITYESTADGSSTAVVMCYG